MWRVLHCPLSCPIFWLSKHPHAQIYLYGAQLLTFTTSAGQQVLYHSTRAIFDGKEPIRGGVPIVFPQFARQGPLPMHGFARTSLWTVEEVGEGHAKLSLTDSEATRALWPHAFRLETRITISDDKLTQTLSVTNPKGAPAPFAFEALLHTYLFLGNDAAGAVELAGLGGVSYLDKPAGGAERVQEEGALKLSGEIDRVYMNTPCVPRVFDTRLLLFAWTRMCAVHSSHTVTLTLSSHPHRCSADVTISGITSGAGITSGRVFNSVVVKRRAVVRQAAPALSQVVVHAPLDVVVWNPGPVRAAAIPDLGPDDWRHYVCVEPGRVSRETSASATLAAGKEWTLTMDVELVY